MRTLALAALCVALAGCGSLGGNNGLGLQALENLKECRRSYTGTLGALPSGSVHIECEPQSQVVARAAAPVE
jgi:hypothetical protein